MENVTHLDVEAEPRYWDDCSLNGVIDDQDNPKVFGHENGVWKIRINLMEGRIEGWPADVEANIHYKVCDAGEYWLSGADGTRLYKFRGSYVPSTFLCYGSNGFGDYIIMKVLAGGEIVDFHQPHYDPEAWAPRSA